MKFGPALLLFSVLFTTAYAQQPRINHEGRILPDPPVVTTPLLFNTAQADAVVSGLQILPKDNPWNESIVNRPYLNNSKAASDAMIAQIKGDLASDRRKLAAFYEMNYVLVPDNQSTRQIEFTDFADESDLDGGTDPFGIYPIPDNMPVETWPRGTGTLTNEQWQATDVDDDRHSIIIKPGAGFIWEMWHVLRTGPAVWQAANGAKFPLNTNAQRPNGWTSGDAAGLSMFAGLVRYDECARGMVEHAVRLVVKRTRENHIYPATHHTFGNTAATIPAMGQRLRLNKDFVIPAGWSIYEKALALALKKYGAIVADNGNFFQTSVAPDQRFPSNAFANIGNLLVDNFEVIQTTGANEGPRSPGAPSVDFGVTPVVSWPGSAVLTGLVTDPDTPTANLTIAWKMYSGPGTVTFGSASAAQSTATFSKPGRYILMISVDDGVHTTAYKAVTIDVPVKPDIIKSGANILVRFQSATSQSYLVEHSNDLATWTTLANNVAGTGAVLDVTHSNAVALGQHYYRVSVLP